MKHIKTIILTILMFVAITSVDAQSKQLKKINADGKVEQTGYVRDGVHDSTWVAYDAKGDTASIAHYSMGCKVGRWEIRTPDRIFIINYENGSKKSSTIVTPNGILLASREY